MSSRYGAGNLTDRSRNSLFSAYDSQRTASRSPDRRPGSGYGNRYATPESQQQGNGHGGPPAFNAYPGANATPNAGFRTATPNGKGMYSDSVMDSLESQNDEQVSGIIAKVGRLKDLTLKIGDEIRDSSNLMDTMNDEFSSAGTRLKRTMGRMMRMADATGVGWRVWLGFFAAVMLLFCYVWLF